LEKEIASSKLESTAMVVLDLEDLKFIDSTGLRVVLSAHERTRQRGQEFAVTRGSPQVQRLLSITGAGEHLRVIASSDDMLV
jgi:anti-anti-sigma factor